MSEDKNDFPKDFKYGTQLQRDILENRRRNFVRDFKDQLGADLVKDEQLSDIFSEGIKKGEVVFTPKKDGTGTLNVDTIIKGEKLTKQFEIEDKDEAAFLMGLQVSLRPSEDK
jgi:hypothetical protein